VRLYHGLPVAGAALTRPWTKPEIARHLGGGCTVWRVTEALRRALARLRSEEVPSPEERRAVRRARISAAARHRGRAAAAFGCLAEPERTLVRRYYGLEDARPWTRRELAAAFGRSPEWVARAVARGTARLLGEQAPRPAERLCVVCGAAFVPGPEAYHTARQTCGDACHRELRRRRATASRAARKLRG
jgi:hypothetical protein